jgi:hypothetical protein
LPDIQFSRLDLTGEIGEGAINFGTVDGRAYGGKLTGNAYLSWQGGWQLQGALNAEAMELSTALPTIKLSGELSGNASFAFHGDRLGQLATTPRLVGTVSVHQGAFNNVDMVETVRAGKKQVLGGVTHFEELNGTLLVDATGQHVKQIRVSAGAMSMVGAAEATPDGKLSGQLLVDLNKVRAGMGTLPLTLTGTVSAPAWRIGR